MLWVIQMCKPLLRAGSSKTAASVPHLAAWTGSAAAATPEGAASLWRGCAAPDQGGCAGAGPAKLARRAGPARLARRPQAPAAASLRAQPPAGNAASAAGCPRWAAGRWRRGRGPPASGAGAGAGSWQTRCWHRCRQSRQLGTAAELGSSGPDRKREMAWAGGRWSLSSTVDQQLDLC